MEQSVYQARWLIVPLFGVCIAFLATGIFLTL